MRIRRFIITVTGLTIFAFAFPVFAGEEHHHDKAGKETHASHMLEGYAVLSTALYKDDLAEAQKAAAGMVKHDKDSAMATHCQAIAESKSLEEARGHFKELSDAAIPIAKAAKTMHVIHCPMAFGGKGADWLQKTVDEIQNPCLGTKMPHCGEEVK